MDFNQNDSRWIALSGELSMNCWLYQQKSNDETHNETHMSKNKKSRIYGTSDQSVSYDLSDLSESPICQRVRSVRP